MSLTAFHNYQLTAQQSPKSLVYTSHDNDLLKVKNVTDRYYSFGLFAGFQKVLNRRLLRILPTRHFKDPWNKYIGGLVVAIKGYTPNRDRDRDNSLLDRPFAGTFTIRPYVISVNKNRLIRLDLETGVRGPASQAGKLQNWVHERIGDNRVKGWDNQLDNKILFSFYGLYAKPFLLSKGFEVIPESSIALGNHFTYLQQGIKLRVGLFNDVSNSISYFTHMGGKRFDRHTEIFASFIIYGRLSLLDATLSDLNLISDLLSVSKDHLVGGFQVKLNFLLNRVGIIIAYNKITPGTNLSDKHSYGSIGLNYRW